MKTIKHDGLEFVVITERGERGKLYSNVKAVYIGETMVRLLDVDHYSYKKTGNNEIEINTTMLLITEFHKIINMM